MTKSHVLVFLVRYGVRMVQSMMWWLHYRNEVWFDEDIFDGQGCLYDSILVIIYMWYGTMVVVYGVWCNDLLVARQGMEWWRRWVILWYGMVMAWFDILWKDMVLYAVHLMMVLVWPIKSIVYLNTVVLAVPGLRRRIQTGNNQHRCRHQKNTGPPLPYCLG